MARNVNCVQKNGSAGLRFEKNLESIFFVDAVFGWTVIGWLTAAFWAIAERKPETAKPPPVNQT